MPLDSRNSAQLGTLDSLASSGSIEEEPKSSLEKLDQILRSRRSAAVKRYHTWPIIGEQTDGHHTHNMLSMLFELHPNPSIPLIYAIHVHDNAERVIGDAPSPGLRMNTTLAIAYEDAQESILADEYGVRIKDLPVEDRSWLHALDKLEAYLFAIDQLRLGNKNALNIIKNVDQWFLIRDVDGMVPPELMEVFTQARDIDGLR